MSVEAFTHQLYEPLIIPDAMEARLRDILANQAHIHGIDLEIALQNPADMIQRLSTLLINRYDTPAEIHMQISEFSKTFTVGTGFEDGIQVQQGVSAHGIPTAIELSMATDAMNTLYPEGTIAHITIADDMSWVNVIGFAGRHHGIANYTEVRVHDTHVINEIYSHAITRLLNAVDDFEKLPALSDYVVRELGKSALLSKLAA